VPSVSGLTREQAVRELRQSDLRVTPTDRPSATVDAGLAIGTSPREGTTIERRSNVRLFVSSGPEQVEVPNLVGLSLASATGRLDDLGLTYRTVSEPSDQPEDEVIAQDPGEGATLDPGGRVTLTVAEPIEQVPVPFVVGLSQQDALDQLRGDGLKGSVRERDVDDESQDGVVLEQRPGGDTAVDDGSTVVLVVGRFVEPTPPPTTPDESP
jgi:serine/threonine-protein kinase